MSSGAELDYAQVVGINSMRRFLLLHKWGRHESVRSGLDLYRLRSAYGTAEIILPQMDSHADAVRRKADALRILCQLTGKDLPSLAASIREVGFDVWRTIVPDALVSHESIALKIAQSFIKNAKELLASSATTESNPKPFFGRVTKLAANFADDCRFAHTFRGSFGFSIEAAVSENISPTMPWLEEHVPFERRVMERIARGLRAIN